MNEEVVKKIQDLVVRASQKDPEALQQLQQIKQAAEAGDQQAGQLWQVIQQVVQSMQGGQQGVSAARNGAKLNYVKELKGICPEGYLKTGGRCKPCEAKMKAKGGDMDPVKSFKAGRKCKK